jgi:hypothetical protein
MSQAKTYLGHSPVIKRLYRPYYILANGRQQNLNEARYSRQLAGLAIRTRFSFWGFLNVQDTAKPSNLKWDALLNLLVKQLDFSTMDSIACFGHDFNAKTNLGLDGSKLKFLDYGNHNLIQFILRHRAIFEQALGRLSDKS